MLKTGFYGTSDSNTDLGEKVLRVTADNLKLRMMVDLDKALQTHSPGHGLVNPFTDKDSVKYFHKAIQQ